MFLVIIVGSCSKYFCDKTDDSNSNDINYMEKIVSTDSV